MHTIDIPERKITLQLPSEWDDCSQEQAQFVLAKAFDVMNGLLSMSEFRIQVFIYLTGLKLGLGYLIKQKLGINTAANERIYQLSHQLCDWIFNKTDDGNYELQYETIQNFYPVLDGKYHGPADLLSDITLGEFNHGLAALNQYFESKDTPEEAVTHLDYFIAMLYRPLDDQNRRVPFKNYIIDTEPFQKVPLWQKQSIAIWFTYCVKCLQTEDIVINGIECNLSVLFPKAAAGTPVDSRVAQLGWTGITMSIAESGVFGDVGHTSSTGLYEILLYLLKKHQEQPKQTK